ncbi:MAG: M48 family metalloprotease, partial [Gammaproteobacteria bacterium]|nr:M48 family metalloprotease [Gammaproteobacteria bacterium]
MSSVFHRQTENRGCRRSCGQVPSQVRHIRQKLKITLSRRYLILLSLLPVVAVALLALTPDNAWAAKKKKTEEPELFGDAALGHKYHRQIVATYGTYDNDNGLAGYVQQVGEEIATHADGESFAWHFTILDSESINAFALPGGFIYITRALLTHLNSEAQLAAVLGHEIAHSASRH